MHFAKIQTEKVDQRMQSLLALMIPEFHSPQECFEWYAATARLLQAQSNTLKACFGLTTEDLQALMDFGQGRENPTDAQTKKQTPN